MLHAFRESVGRYVAIVILALLAVTFIFWGVGTNSSFSRDTFAAKVNGEAIPLQDFERELQLAQNDYQQRTRSELSDDVRLALRQQVLDQLVLRDVIKQRVHDVGYRVSEQRLDEAIRSNEAFQVGGQYSEDVALSLLASQQLTPSSFKNYERESMLISDWQDALVESAFTTPSEFRHFIELYYETRQVGWAVFDAASFEDQVEVSDDDIAAYYAENSDSFMSDESVDIEFVELTLAEVAATVEISEDELRAQYEADVDLYSQAEEREVRHILIEVGDDDPTGAEAEAKAEDVLERLEAGEDFATLAAEVSDDAGTRNNGGDLGWISRGVLSGPFEDAVFSMNVGDLAGPVETEFGFHIIRLDGIRAGQQASFESVRDQIREQLAENEAYSTFLDKANELDQAAYDAGSDLAGVAEQFGLELETIDGLTRTGGTNRFANPAPIIAAAFDDEAIATGENSALIDLGDDNVAIIRVTGHDLPEVEPLEVVSDQIRQILLQDGAGELASAAADDFYAALDSDALADGSQDPAELAEAHGATWNGPVWARRADVNVPSPVLQTVFAAPRSGVEQSAQLLRASLGSGDQAVIVFSGVKPGVPDDIPSSQRELDQQQLTNQNADAELNFYARDARQNAKIRVPDGVLNPDL
jgi:peptidyl-prolyl cis-trans isomerase D